MAPPKKTKFRGNENLKAGFVTENISPEEFEFRAREIVKCRNDIVYFADNYYTIVAPKLGKHIIKTFPRQKELLRFMQDNDRVVCCSSRQTAKCCLGTTIVKIRNKTTGEIEKITVEEFHKRFQK